MSAWWLLLIAPAAMWFGMLVALVGRQAAYWSGYEAARRDFQ